MNWTVQLARALEPLSFLSFETGRVAATDLSDLESVVTQAEQALVAVAHGYNWSEVAAKLHGLRGSAQFVALRADRGDLDLILGRVPRQYSVAEEVDYQLHLVPILIDMQDALRSVELNEEGKAQASALAAPLVSGTPAGAFLPLFLELFQLGGFVKCLVIVPAQNVSSQFVTQWGATDMAREVRSRHTFGNVGFLATWLWDVGQNRVYRGGAQFFEKDFPGIANLTPDGLERAIRFAGA